MLRKGVYHYEFMDYAKFNEISLIKKDFYCHLNMEDITDADYAHAKRVYKDFEKKNWGEYQDLYVQIDTLLLADDLGTFEICMF